MIEMGVVVQLLVCGLCLVGYGLRRYEVIEGLSVDIDCLADSLEDGSVVLVLEGTDCAGDGGRKVKVVGCEGEQFGRHAVLNLTGSMPIDVAFNQYFYHAEGTGRPEEATSGNSVGAGNDTHAFGASGSEAPCREKGFRAAAVLLGGALALV